MWSYVARYSVEEENKSDLLIHGFADDAMMDGRGFPVCALGG
jgi:hypothetical protein